MEAARRQTLDDSAPAIEPMRGTERRLRVRPSKEDRSIRRRNRRRQQSAQTRAAAVFDVPDSMVYSEDGKDYITAGGRSIGPLARALVLDCVACGHMTRYASKRCRECGSLMLKTATVLMTQIERANPGDAMRTPQGQTVHIKKIRRHETDNGKVYVDTDQGTSLMNRGTDVNLTQGERQQELPDSGHPTGNAGQLPGAGRTPTGEGGGSMPQGAAPHCPRDGVRMVLRSNTWVCPIDGTTAPTTSSPAGMHPTDRPSGQILNPERNRNVPQTHLWASYHTAGQPPAIVRRARQVLDTMEEIRS